MRIIAIEEKTLKRKDPLKYLNKMKYLNKIVRSLSSNPDVVVGPDYALCFLDEDDRISFACDRYVFGRLEEISSKHPETLIIPGTGPVLLGGNQMGLSAKVFYGGKKIKEFFKETDAGESDLAKKNGLVYKKGDHRTNNIIHNGKKIEVEICSDHGKQHIDKDTFLEVILAYDDNAGFYTSSINDGFQRYAVICDGRKPFVDCQRFDPNDSNRLRHVPERKIGDSIYEFTLK